MWPLSFLLRVSKSTILAARFFCLCVKSNELNWLPRFLSEFHPSSIICSISLILFSICAINSNPYFFSSSLFIAISTSLPIFYSWFTCLTSASIYYVDVDFFRESSEFLAVAISSRSSSSEANPRYSSQLFLSKSTRSVSLPSFTLSFS